METNYLRWANCHCASARTATASTLTKTDTETQTPAADTLAPISPTQSAPVDTVAATPGADTPDQIPATEAPCVPAEIPAAIEAPVEEAAVVTPPDTPVAATYEVDSKVTTLIVYQRDRTRLTQLLDTISPTNTSQQEKIAALLDWAEQQLAVA